MRLADTKALTLLNPWAWAVSHLGKRVENRGWSAPEGVDYLLIHAGKGNDPGGLPFIRRLGIDAIPNTVTSAIVAVARLAHVCDATVGRPSAPCGCGRWGAPGQYHWVFCDVWPLGEPVECRGFQKLWNPSAADLAAVEQQVSR